MTPTPPDRCLAFYDGDRPSAGTHTCARLERHDGEHYCPDCRSTWDKPGGRVSAIQPGWSDSLGAPSQETAPSEAVNHAR